MGTLAMLLKMSAITAFCVLLTFILWKKTRNLKMTIGLRIAIGVIYGTFSVLSTHFGVDYTDMILNVRDLGPMSAGLFFDPVAGIVAGLIGGIERYIAGTYFGVGVFTCLACSVSTCLAGFFAAFLNKVVLKGGRPSVGYAFFMGSLIEVFHMYAIFMTHQDNILYAFEVVRICALPMIIFSGIGLAAATAAITVSSGKRINPFRAKQKRDLPVLDIFHRRLLGVIGIVLIFSFGFNYSLQTQSAKQDAARELQAAEDSVRATYEMLKANDGTVKRMVTQVGYYGSFTIIDSSGKVIAGLNPGNETERFVKIIKGHREGKPFTATYAGHKWLCQTGDLRNGVKVLVLMPYSEIFKSRDIHAYETLLADLLLFAIIFMLISLLVNTIVINNLIRVNRSLNKITEGNLNEKVDVYSSIEFSSLSEDINKTVDTLKGYIADAEKRMEKELQLARTIQDSALPKNFDFKHPGFEVYATMEPAREVGGDFYDVFFVGRDKLALVIADVSDKGIPAALFMMQSKMALRGLAETGTDLMDVFVKVNNELCDGNDVNMFVTVWMGIVDLKQGTLRCINAGHEYPVIRRAGEDYQLFKEKHSPPLGLFEDLTFKDYIVDIEPGDCLFVYTDGVPEATNREVEQFGTERMLASLNKNKEGSMAELLFGVKRDMDDFVGDAKQFDDITMLGFRYNGPRTEG